MVDPDLHRQMVLLGHNQSNWENKNCNNIVNKYFALSLLPQWWALNATLTNEIALRSYILQTFSAFFSWMKCLVRWLWFYLKLLPGEWHKTPVMTSQQSLGHHYRWHYSSFVFFSARNLQRSSPWSAVRFDTEAERLDREAGTWIWRAAEAPQALRPLGRKLGPSHQWVALRTFWMNPQDLTFAIPSTKDSLVQQHAFLCYNWCLLISRAGPCFNIR